MAFPPTFDRSFDETFPPDTQAANLLGQDIRNLKTDIRERFALHSGTLANRPTNMDATFGGAGYGWLYFSTDTSQIFQWNGAAWVDVTPSFSRSSLLNAQASLAPIVGNNANQVLFTYNLPGGTVAALQGIRISASASIVGAPSPSPTYIYSINGVQIASELFGPGPSDVLTILNTAPTTGAFAFNSTRASAVSLPSYQGTLAGLVWANAQTLQLTFNCSAVGTVTPLLWTVELLR